MTASILGKNIATGDVVTLEQKQRFNGLYVIGKTGSGKTTLLVNLILQDIEQGMGVCFFALPARRNHANDKQEDKHNSENDG